MKLTKKQIAALNRVIGREVCANEKHKREGGAGLHPTKERFVVTDGTLAVFFTEKIDELPEAAENDFFCTWMENVIKNSDSILVPAPPTVADCKRAIKEWKDTTGADKPPYPSLKITAQLENGNVLAAHFDPYLIMDALEAIGSTAMVYIGKDRKATLARPIVSVYTSTGRGSFKYPDLDGTVAMVLSLNR